MGLIINMSVALLNTLLNHTMLTRKKTVLFCVFAFLINSIVVIAVLTSISRVVTDIDTLKYIFCFIMFIYIAYIHLVFEETLSKKLFVMFSTWVISAIIYHISILISRLFFDFGNVTNFMYGLRIIFQVILFWFLSKPRFRESYKRTLLLVQDSTINLMSIYMIIAFLLLLNNMTNVDVTLRNFDTLYDLLLFFVFIILGYVIVFTGISSSSKMVLLQRSVEMAEKKSELHFKMATIDSLTGVASRLNILSKIEEAINEHEKSAQKLAVLMLDIEMMICRIFEVLKVPLVFNQQEIQVNISVGISIFPDYSQNEDGLINQADQAMYAAKNIEGSSYSFYSIFAKR